MKWRSLLLVVFAVTALFFSSINAPQHAFAQTTPNNQQEITLLFSNLTKIGNDVFYRIDKAYGSMSDPGLFAQAAKLATLNFGGFVISNFNAAQISNAYTTVSPIIQAAQAVFSGSFESKVGALNPPTTVSVKVKYEEAMREAANYIKQEQAKLPAGKNGAFEQQLFTSAIDAINNSAANDTLGNSTTPSNAAIEAKVAEINNQDAKKCSWSWNESFDILGCVDVFVSWFIKNTLLQFAGFLLWATSNLLDYVINVGILGFSSWAPDGLYPLWQTVRQIVSMFVVFSGLWLGFMYIINKGDEFKRYVPWVVIFGLFVNFSYPVTKAAIDISNIISLNIYASALDTTSTLSAVESGSSYTPGKVSAGAKIMSRLGLQGLVVSATSQTTKTASADIKAQINTTPAALLVVGYVFYAAYIFLIAAGILMIRTLALSFIIVASPILFVDAVIPKLGEQAQKLRKIFFEQLTVSVVFMVMLYVSIAMTGVFSKLGGGGVAATGIVQIFNVLMMLIMLHIMLKVTKAVSGSVGQIASDAMGKFGGFAGGAMLGAATGGIGILGRNTIGARAANWATSETEKAERGERSAHDSWLGRKQLALSNTLATGSFDARNTALVGSVAGAMGGTKGLGFTNRFKVNSYNEAKAAYNKETADTAKILQGDRREEFLNKRTGGDDVRNNLAKEDREMMQKYAGASDDVRETMLADKNNTKYKKRFEEIDKFLLAKAGDQDAKEFFDKQDQEMKDILKKQALAKTSKQTNKEINDAKEFLNAKPEEIETLKTYATAAQKNLYEKLEAYKAITGVTAEDLDKKALILASIRNGEVAKTVLNSDEPYRNAKENRALQDRIQLAYNNMVTKGSVPDSEILPTRVTQESSTASQVTVNVNQTVEAPKVIDPAFQSLNTDLADFLKGKEFPHQVAQVAEAVQTAPEAITPVAPRGTPETAPVAPQTAGRPVANPQELESTPA